MSACVQSSAVRLSVFKGTRPIREEVLQCAFELWKFTAQEFHQFLANLPDKLIDSQMPLFFSSLPPSFRFVTLINIFLSSLYFSSMQLRSRIKKKKKKSAALAENTELTINNWGNWKTKWAINNANNFPPNFLHTSLAVPCIPLY